MAGSSVVCANSRAVIRRFMFTRSRSWQFPDKDKLLYSAESCSLVEEVGACRDGHNLPLGFMGGAPRLLTFTLHDVFQCTRIPWHMSAYWKNIRYLCV
jgi:hypothetical protein